MVVKIFCVFAFLSCAPTHQLDCGATGAVFLPPLQMKSECEAGSQADKGVNNISHNLQYNIWRRFSHYYKQAFNN